jgi:CheY-like chemotaxis protein
MIRTEILFINDGSFLLRMMARRLENKGYSTWISDVPEEAMEILSMYDVDWVVITLSEDDTARLAILPMVKELCPQAKLIVISNAEFLPIEVFEADFDDYIGLPCSPSKIWRRLSAFLEEPIGIGERELFLHPANYRILQRLVANLQQIHQNLMDGEAGLRTLQDKAAYQQQPMEWVANLEDAHEKNSQSIVLVEKMLTNFTGHDFFQDQVDCYDI